MVRTRSQKRKEELNAQRSVPGPAKSVGNKGEGSQKVTLLEAIIHLVHTHVHAILMDASDSGIPWSGLQCRSIIAGGTGIMYALPALVCPTWWEKSLWFVQAICSVVADYFEIHHKSYWHGIDRCVATMMTIRAIVICATILRPWIALIALVPLSFYVGSSRAKKSKNLEAWKRSHCGWHVSGSLLVLLTSSCINYCSDDHTLFVTTLANYLPHFTRIAGASCAARM